jgi:4-diphosphocytidyl-2-C-methyl-D-erythritol kinase
LGDDGFHPLVNVFQAVNLFQTVTATASESGSGVTISVTGLGADKVPLDDRNLAHRAAVLVAQKIGIAPDVHLAVHKEVPVAAGMAGGSADAAATLVACNELWGGLLDDKELNRLAAQLGSDVPFALLGGIALGVGRGDVLTPLQATDTFHWVFAVSDQGLSTPLVFRTFDTLAAASSSDTEPEPLSQPPSESSSYVPRLHSAPAPSQDLNDCLGSHLAAALQTGDSTKLGLLLQNDLQPAALHLRPELAATLHAAQDAGALGVIISGSGPTVAALARDEEHAQQIAESWLQANLASQALVTTNTTAGAALINLYVTA